VLQGIRPFFLLVSAVLLLSGCYFPTKFTADITIERNGDYTLDYVGQIANAPLLTDLRTTSMSPETERERVATILADLRRDSGFQEVRYLGGGMFDVRYRRTGNLEKQPSVTFIRPNSQILTITYIRSKSEVTVRGGTIPLAAIDRVRALNLEIDGIFRVHTAMAVKSHNATAVTPGALTTYTWAISGFDSPAPKLVIQ